jgi:hypothetical protein
MYDRGKRAGIGSADRAEKERVAFQVDLMRARHSRHSRTRRELSGEHGVPERHVLGGGAGACLIDDPLIAGQQLSVRKRVE